MILVISPSKTMDERMNRPAISSPVFLKHAMELSNVLQKKSKEDLQSLMDISPKLAALNYNRFQNINKLMKAGAGVPAILSFKGDVYVGLNADDFSEDHLEFANEHIRILSGLYGLLNPLDKICPYRLEMGSKLEVKDKKNLYQFWGDKITQVLNQQILEHLDKTIINLASEEYFKVINPKRLKGNVLNIHFKEERNGKLQFISFNAKKARGLMCRFAILNRIKDHNDLKAFNLDHYYFSEELSDEKNWIFIR